MHYKRPILSNLLKIVFALGMSVFSFAIVYANTPTTITSDQMDMQGTADKNYFTFIKNVKVNGENLALTCNRLEVVSARAGDPNATIGKIGAIETIIAKGNVVITQGTRTAYAGHAVMDPRLGLLILTEDPRIVDGDTTVMGSEITLDKQKNVRVKDGKTILSGELPKFNFDREAPPPAAGSDWIGGGDALDPAR